MEKSKNTTLRYYIDLIVVCALAFVSAYMLLPKGEKIVKILKIKEIS